jgi:pSer/pThr/pTyr-binding forkhead associated (FHA) protein
MPQLKIFLSADNRITFEIGDERVTIGRLAHNILQIDEVSVSSHHAEIFFEAGKYHLQDSASTNGTFVNGERISDAVLHSGDDLRFGTVEGIFLSEEEPILSQPRPNSFSSSPEVATSSARPGNFFSSSPSPKGTDTRNPLGIAVYALAALAICSFGAALFLILQM